ncbi:hypothetical protein [Kineosporia sp. NBRC 101677]|uniref:hypothetical protein n=1 Tax=Kineosporia sp. NBRC 101677 TaxID=3032197 RepID=UPI0025560661|nr:hypothetical protein [Kineosporia sp. NBRC 101677]
MSQVVHHMCWQDPSLDQLCAAVKGQDGQARLNLLLPYLRPLRNRPDQHVQASSVINMSLAVEPMQALLQHPGTPADDRADVLTLLGNTLISRAQDVRGTGPASTVPESAWPRFRAILEEADDILAQAQRIYPQHPGAATFRLSAALGLGVSSDEWWSRFETARTAQPTLYTAHETMLTVLSPKWYGSDEAMFGFGHQIAEQAPPGDPVVAMLPLAHSEYICAVQMGRSRPDGPSPEAARLHDEDAVMAASWKWAGDGTRPAPPHPYALDAHNLFAWFLGNSRQYRERGRWHLQQTRHRISGQPWCWLSDEPAQAYAQLHADLGVD